MGNTVTKSASVPNLRALVNEKDDSFAHDTSSPDSPLKPVVIVTTDNLNEGLPPLTPGTTIANSETESLVSSISDPLASPASLDTITPAQTFAVAQWDGQQYFADLVRDGLAALHKDNTNVLMLYESPSSSSTETSFYNSQVFNYHDFPAFPPYYKSVLAPCRYSIMNGSTYPSYLRDDPPSGLIEHWQATVPDFVAPTFVPTIDEQAQVYAYLPVEHLNLDNHVLVPHVHYHLAGKDAIHLMTNKTTRLLANTQDERPCVAKVTHAMGSKGIFVIRNDEDEVEFNEFLLESGNPTFVVTEYVEIARNVACHFFVHPSGDVTFFGSNENVLLPNGDWSTDSTIVMAEQEMLKNMQLPYVQDVVAYCRALGFWGFCGVDVLFDTNGKGYVVDVNPRVTGTCPALMIAQLLQARYGFTHALFRRNSSFAYRGTAAELLAETEAYNKVHEGSSRIVLHSFYEKKPTLTLLNIAVYGTSLETCQEVLDRLAPPIEDEEEASA
jgi:hypothetical protein